MKSSTGNLDATPTAVQLSKPALADYRRGNT
jgi:hypothetical protein